MGDGLDAPRYILFAGVNGAGKSTLYRSGLWNAGAKSFDLPRVNSDEILAARGWDWADERMQLRAGREAVRLVRLYFGKRESFNQESTLAGRSIMRNLSRAHELGYRTVMYYVGVESPAIADERIAYRVLHGGHRIAPDVVERRYRLSLSNLAEALRICDEVYLFDNTSTLRLVGSCAAGELVHYDDFPRVAWAHDVLSSVFGNV